MRFAGGREMRRSFTMRFTTLWDPEQVLASAKDLRLDATMTCTPRGFAATINEWQSVVIPLFATEPF